MILTFTFVAYAATINLSCAHKSAFPLVENHPGNKYVVQFCGGRQWGYVKPIGADSKTTYMAVYLQSEIAEKSDAIIFNFTVQSNSNFKFTQPTKALKILTDGREVFSSPAHFAIIRVEKKIWDRYPNGYVYKQVNNSRNEWEVRKEKFGGFFGRMAVEEPFTIKIADETFEEMKSPAVKLDFNDIIDSTYIISKAIIPFAGEKSKTSRITVELPTFKINDDVIPATEYVFNYDREQLAIRMKDSNRCASLEEIFRAGRNKESWIWWMYPRMTN